MLIGFRSAASVVDQQRKSKHKKHKVPSRKIKRFQPEGRVHGVWIRSHQKGGGSALTVHTLSSLRGGGGGCVVDHDVVCVYGYRSQWYMAVGCSFTDNFWARLLQLPPSGDCLLRPPPFPVGVAAPGEEE